VADSLPAPGQPFTFPGVARYASARFGRLLVFALVFALPAGIALVFLAARGWWPVLTEAIESLPPAGQIENGTLRVEDLDARLLGANQFLSIQYSLRDMPSDAAPVDLAVAFGRYEILMSSIWGDLALIYPTAWSIPFNRSALAPFWGAWKAPLLVAFGLTAIAGLVLAWFALALLYAPIVLFLGGLSGRELNFSKAWKISVAAQWPASLLMTFAIALYATGEIGLLFILIMFAAHFLPTLLHILIAPFLAPKAALPEAREGRRTRKNNPFTTEKRRSSGARNPFRRGTEDD
jgi:hypothetical protein